MLITPTPSFSIKKKMYKSHKQFPDFPNTMAREFLHGARDVLNIEHARAHNFFLLGFFFSCLFFFIICGSHITAKAWRSTVFERGCMLLTLRSSRSH